VRKSTKLLLNKIPLLWSDLSRSRRKLADDNVIVFKNTTAKFNHLGIRAI